MLGVVQHVYFVCYFGVVLCILFLHTLLKVVSHYDLSVLSVSVVSFQKNIGWGGDFFKLCIAHYTVPSFRFY